MCEMCAMADGRSGGSSAPVQAQPEASGGMVAVPVTQNEDGTVTITLSREEFASIQLQLMLASAVMSGGPLDQ